MRSLWSQSGLKCRLLVRVGEVWAQKVEAQIRAPPVVYFLCVWTQKVEEAQRWAPPMMCLLRRSVAALGRRNEQRRERCTGSRASPLGGLTSAATLSPKQADGSLPTVW